MPTGRRELLRGERAMLFFPLRDGRKAVTDAQRAPGGLGHPGRDAETLGLSRLDHLGMDVSVDADCELDGRISSRHSKTILPW